MAKKIVKAKPGLTKGRVGWTDDDMINLSCSYLSARGLHGKTIAKATDLTVSQVYYRCKQLGIHLRDYRDGKGAGRYLVQTYSVKTLNHRTKKDLQIHATRPAPKRKKK